MFGKSGWRSGQRELISAALAGQNVLGVFPTGHGKSLCYQAAAELLGGTSMVVSPLIALMRDQVQQLQKLGMSAERFDSTLEPQQRSALLQRLADGQLRLLFVAPESLEHADLLAAWDKVGERQLFVVDEAHCVSEWGHSFRPDYLKLPDFFRRLGFRSAMAITATATHRVQQDLCAHFDIAPQQVWTLSPYRPNIERRVVGVEDKLSYTSQFLAETSHRPSIIYVRTRKGTEEVAAALQQRGYAAVGYHAGMSAENREKLQDAFLRNEYDVLVATIAFGMGIDKPDIRSVVHYDEPTSPEAYLQESGRGGRDGRQTVSLVMLSENGRIDAENRIYASEPDVEGVERAVRWLMPQGARAVSMWELGTSCDVPDDVPARALALLEQCGAVQQVCRGYKYYKVKPLFPLATILDGRDAEESARLSWLHRHLEGEVEDAADAWACSYAEAMELLSECEASGEWKLTFRQQALYLRSVGPGDARAVAASLSGAYGRRRDADLARCRQLFDMLSRSCCINASIEAYFTGATIPPCGHCSACRGENVVLPQACAPLPLPPESELPEFSRSNQRRRFLLGLASPALNARRLWNHPHYAAAAGTPWQSL